MLNESQNSIPEENSIPVSPQEPIEPAPIPPSTSEPTPMPPEVPESPTEAESAVPVKDHNGANEPLNQKIPENIEISENQNITVERTPDGVTITEVMEPTAQMAGNEPLENKRRENLNKANLTRQNKKRKKIDSILTLFTEKQYITNDEVEKLLHVSDATATRYLSILEKEGKIKQSGRTGQSVSYSRI